MYSRKSVGPRMEPLGTPALTGYSCEDFLHTLKKKSSKSSQKKMLETIFIEIINPSTKNLIVGCIYCHLCIELSKFNNDFFTYLCKKLLREKNKGKVLMADFNVNLIKI